MTQDRAILLVAIFLFILGILVFTSVAVAHDYEKPELKDWFMQLQNRRHGMCCDGSDASHVESQDWTTQDKEHSHYKVNIEGEWVDVPDDALVDDPNKEGQALVWYYPVWTGTKMDHAIRCFMPGTMG